MKEITDTEYIHTLIVLSGFNDQDGIGQGHIAPDVRLVAYLYAGDLLCTTRITTLEFPMSHVGGMTYAMVQEQVSCTKNKLYYLLFISQQCSDLAAHEIEMSLFLQQRSGGCIGGLYP
jgi:hypothetical protein